MGFLASKWMEPGQPGRPPRHLYRLTGDGAALAREVAAEAKPASRGKAARAGT
jgi:DNA-binding PadR family transcriptional regulator